jgi:Protein of unknown function (DUF2510)
MSAPVDTSRLSFGALITGVGGLLLLFGTFIDWAERTSAWKLYTFVDLLLVIVALIAIATAAMQLMTDPPALPVRPADAALWGGVFALGVSISVIDALEDSKFGLVLTFLASLVIIAGSVLARREPATGYGRAAGAGTAPAAPLGTGPPGVGSPAAGPAASPAAATPAAATPGAASPAAATSAATEGGAAAGTGASAGSPDPDWYPDPKGEARLRYWDGTRWTEQTAD